MVFSGICRITISACIFYFVCFFHVANVQHGARAAEETVGISVFFDEGMDEDKIRKSRDL